jgi:hypothetical protein
MHLKLQNRPPVPPRHRAAPHPGQQNVAAVEEKRQTVKEICKSRGIMVYTGRNIAS